MSGVEILHFSVFLCEIQHFFSFHLNHCYLFWVKLGNFIEGRYYFYLFLLIKKTLFDFQISIKVNRT